MSIQYLYCVWTVVCHMVRFEIMLALSVLDFGFLQISNFQIK